MKIRSPSARPLMVGAAIFAMALSGSADKAFAQAGKDFKVAYLPCGRVNDQSWSQAGYEGILAAKKELGVEASYSESVSPADIEAAARDYASRGYNLVLLHCATFMDAGLKVSSDFPKTFLRSPRRFRFPATSFRSICNSSKARSLPACLPAW